MGRGLFGETRGDLIAASEASSFGLTFSRPAGKTVLFSTDTRLTEITDAFSKDALKRSGGQMVVGTVPGKKIKNLAQLQQLRVENKAHEAIAIIDSDTARRWGFSIESEELLDEGVAVSVTESGCIVRALTPDAPTPITDSYGPLLVRHLLAGQLRQGDTERFDKISKLPEYKVALTALFVGLKQTERKVGLVEIADMLAGMRTDPERTFKAKLAFCSSLLTLVQTLEVSA